jgi:hypothetical protein
MRNLTICTLILMMLFAGLLTAQTSPNVQKAMDMYQRFIPRPAPGSMAKSTVLSEYEEQYYWGDWESDRKVQITHNDQMRIHSLLHDHKSAGKHQIAFDGKDDNGRALSSGIYFMKLNAGQQSNTKKLILHK